MKLDRQKVLSEMKKKNMTQKDLAEKCGYSVSTVNRMLQGKLLSQDEADCVSKVLKLSVKEITYEEEKVSSLGAGFVIGAGVAAAVIIGALIANAKKDNSLSEEDKQQLIDLLKK